jgi:hypothetical protein
LALPITSSVSQKSACAWLVNRGVQIEIKAERQVFRSQLSILPFNGGNQGGLSHSALFWKDAVVLSQRESSRVFQAVPEWPSLAVKASRNAGTSASQIP